MKQTKTKQTKKERICDLMSRGKVRVRIKNPLPKLSGITTSKDFLIGNRKPGAHGIIKGIELNTGGSYYIIKHERTQALYHINDFTI